jgi:hypothetical protein
VLGATLLTAAAANVVLATRTRGPVRQTDAVVHTAPPA